MEPICIRDDSRQFLGVAWIDQVNLHELTERREIKKKLIVPQGLNILEIVVHVTGESSQLAILYG
jgi:hypothetical protein